MPRARDASSRPAPPPSSAAPPRSAGSRPVPSARPGRTAATVLVLGLLLLGAAAAEAQTVRILVSNSGQVADDSANTSGNDHAQLFQTGAHAAGYTLTQVVVNSEDNEGDDFDVEVCEEDGTSDEFPSTTAGDCTALTAPASFAAGNLHFPHAGLALSANTNYVVVVKQIGTGSVELNTTTSGGEDTSLGLSDWSIKNKFYWKSGSSWMLKSGSDEALRIIVRGYARIVAPTVTGVALTSDPNDDGRTGDDATYAYYGSTLVQPDVVEATVTFDAAADITGTPQLELDFAGTPKMANCAAATTTTTMVCSYTVAENDSAPNGIEIAADKLTLNGGTITAAGSTTVNAVLTHSAVAIDSGHKVDGVRPTLVTTGTDAPQTSTDGTQVILTFSEDLGSVDLGDFSLEVDSNINQQIGATATFSGRTVTVTLGTAFTIDYGQTVEMTLIAGGAADTAGNINSSIRGQAVTNKVPQPPASIDTVEITSDPGMDKIYAPGDDIEVTVTFDQAVNVSGTPQILLRLGAGGRRWAEYSSGTGTTALVFSYPVAAMDESSIDGIGVGLLGFATDDVDLNGGTITVVATGENASLSYVPLQADSGHLVNWARPTLSDAVTSTDGTRVILTFSEDLDGEIVGHSLFTVKVDGTAVTLSGTTATVSSNVVTMTLATALTSATQAVTVSYTDPTSGDDSIGIEDLANNDADSFTDQTVTNRFGLLGVESVALTSAPGPDNTYAIGDDVEATVTFDAAVDIAGTPQLELDFDGTAKAAACATGTNTTTMVCEYEVAVSDSAPNGIAIGANKLTGGTIRATGSTTVSADLAHAAVAIDADHKVDGIRPTLVTTGSDAPTTSSDGETVLLTFSENIEVVTRSLITIQANGATVSTTMESIVGTKVELTLTTALTAAATNLTVALAADAVEDAVGNGNLALAATGVTNAVVSTTTDATLSALSVSGATLSPAFDALWTAYHATVANAVSQVTITATTSDATATVEYLDDSDARADGRRHHDRRPPGQPRRGHQHRKGEGDRARHNDHADLQGQRGSRRRARRVQPRLDDEPDLDRKPDGGEWPFRGFPRWIAGRSRQHGLQLRGHQLHHCGCTDSVQCYVQLRTRS